MRGRTIAHTAHDLSTLRLYDRAACRIFGAWYHGYELVPVSQTTLASFENDIGAALPHAYQTHLLTHGAGAGPYYGLLSPHAIMREWESWRDDDCQHTAPTVSPARLFPLTLADTNALRPAGQGGRPWRSIAWPCDGCIPIAHQGCDNWSVLVTAGDFAGTVWDLAIGGDFEAVVALARRPIGILRPGFTPVALGPLPSPPPFNTWYRGWVDQALADLGLSPSALAP